MEFLKKIFAAKESSQIAIGVPFAVDSLKYQEQYFYAIVSIIRKHRLLDDLNAEFVCTLEFGSPSGKHLLYFSDLDLNIFMEPDQREWIGKEVMVARLASEKEIFEINGAKFLFRFDNPVYSLSVTKNDDPTLEWIEHAYVYEWI